MIYDDKIRLIPVAIVTGFLGSGKTTLIRHVLGEVPARHRIAVIVNDLADLNIDGEVIRGVHVDRMVKQTNGCVCCSGLYQLGLALREIVEAGDPTMILIETSGAAEPGPVVEQLSNLGFRTDAVITIADAEQFRTLAVQEAVVTRQIEAADFVVLNKLDLIHERDSRSLRKTVRRWNPRARLVETVLGRIPVDVILMPAPGRRTDGSSGPSTAPNELNFFTYTSGDPFDAPRLTRFLERIPESIYRAKGFVRFRGEADPFLLNYTCGRFHFQTFPELGKIPSALSGTSRLIFVGREAKAHERSLCGALDDCTAVG